MTDPKVVVIGLDSITPVMVERFLAEGHMPNLQRLRERGWSAEVTPTMPATTPAGWTTIATGAWPSTHGVEGFAVHVPGEPLDRKHHSCSSDSVRAEFIWQAAERAGKRTILLKYPMSWPPRGGDHVIQVDGAGGWGGLKCVWDLAHSSCWDTHPDTANGTNPEEVVGSQEWLTRDQDNLDEEAVQALATREPGAWANLPSGTEPLWETCLELRGAGAAEGVPLYFLALRVNGQECVLVAGARDAEDSQLLSRHTWSDWIPLALPVPSGVRSGHVRLKVMEFDVPTRRLRLYQSQVHQDDGFTRPASLAAELMAAAGPFAEWTESYDRLQGWIDDTTQLEIYEQHVAWMSQAARHLLRHHPWDLFMTQVHFVDMAYHLYWGAVDPRHPQHDPDGVPFFWDLLAKTHQLADRFVGDILDAVDEDTTVIVLGDHGHDLYHTTLLANHLFLRAGLLSLYRDPRTGTPRVDWRHTKAYAHGYRVYLNVAGRDPQGIVRTEEYRATQELVIQALYSVRDARTGEHPVRLAVRREDAQALGLYGETMGDVVFAMAPGYQTRSTLTIARDAWLGGKLQPDRVAVLRQTELFREFTGEHDTALPFTRAIRTMITVAGPGIPSHQRQVPIRLVDIAPTLCHLLHIPLSTHCEGNVLSELVAGNAPIPSVVE